MYVCVYACIYIKIYRHMYCCNNYTTYCKRLGSQNAL